ncbi:hypothetical protein Pla123a_22140 [Posidoniimonas polymericola]|uniref:Uncharacterized protein n=1 Tax=Posidoniimonas polymericola TaxID=2528002 RepID=A0A5C5YRV0_9BACT|nr:hypothetical protein Pla123a_22140 [Posidoniimonas polymericola]
MADQPPSNPYESPQSPSTPPPPIKRLGLIGRYFAALAVLAGALISFAVCFFTVCYTGLAIGGSGPYGLLPEAQMQALAAVSSLLGLVAAVAVARVLTHRLLRGEKDQ